MSSFRNSRHLLKKCKFIFWNQNCSKRLFSRIIIPAEVKSFNHIFLRNGKSPYKFNLLRKEFHTSDLRCSDPKDKGKPKKDLVETTIKLAIMVTAFLYVKYLWKSFWKPDKSEMQDYISWTEFVHSMLAKGEVNELIVFPNYNLVKVILYQDTVINGKMPRKYVFSMAIPNVSQFEEKLREVENELGIKPDQGIPVVYNRDDTVVYLSILVILGVLYYISRKVSVKIEGPFSNAFKFRKANFTLIDPHMPGSGRGVKFSDVAGAHEAKLEIKEFVSFLKSPEVYRKLGARVPKGALLLGPPGCGKTMLAKAVATEGSVPFLAMNGPEFIEMIGGLGAARVRDLFAEAKKKAPCIIYIDEIDTIGRKRAEGNNISGSQSEGEQTLNQLLVEMDGILSKEGVILLASTNRLSVLDKALLRPGRFDRHIIMDLPNYEERKEIFEHHLSSIILENPVTFYSRRMASLTLGFSGADIANVCNEAAICAARNKKKIIDAGDLEYAIERIIGGTEKLTNVITSKERNVVAYHEAGHALVGWLLEHTDALLKVSILPRTNHALGFSQYSPKDQKLYNQDEICEKMCMALGGRVAESITFNKVTTGAKNDLEKVTKMAYAQVRTMGFSKRVGQVSFPEEESREIGRRPYSKMLTAVMDQEVHRIIYECYKKTETLLTVNKEKLKILAEALLKRETLNYDDVVELLGPPLYINKKLIEPLEFENELRNWKNAAKSQ